MALRVDYQNGTTIVAIVGQLLTENRTAFKERVLEEVARGGRRFVIDLRETGYIDSSGLGALVTAAKKVREAGGEIWVANPNNDIRTLFELTKLDLVLPELDMPGPEEFRPAQRLRPLPPSQGAFELPQARSDGRM